MRSSESPSSLLFAFQELALKGTSTTPSLMQRKVGASAIRTAYGPCVEPPRMSTCKASAMRKPKEPIKNSEGGSGLILGILIGWSAAAIMVVALIILSGVGNGY